MERPEFVTEKHLLYLDDLRESGVANVYGAARYIWNKFPGLSLDEARRVLSYWMDTFEKRHPE